MNSKQFKRYNENDLKEALSLISRQVSAREMAEQLGRSHHSARRLMYVFNKALHLDHEARIAFFREQRVCVPLFNKAISDYLAKPKSEEVVNEEVKSEREPEEFTNLDEKLVQARNSFESAMINYTLAIAKSSYKRKLKKARKEDVEKIDRLEKRIKILSKKSKHSSLSFNIKRQLLRKE